MRATLLPVVALFCLFLTGCGPLVMPGVARLEPHEQAQVEDWWSNMLSPVDRLDRDTLLDTLTTFQLFQVGVDRLSIRSEKDYVGGKIVMDVRFDRARPDADGLTVSILDRNGHVVRTEHYTQGEVIRHVKELSQTAPVLAAQGNAAAETPEEIAARIARQMRVDRINAATQPVRP